MSKTEFDKLEARVTRIESFLHLTDTIPPPPLPIPMTVLIEKELCRDNLSVGMLNTSAIYSLLKTDYHIFVRVYLHGLDTVKLLTSTKNTQGYREYYFCNPYFNVLIIKHSDLGTPNEHLWTKMNTVKTSNLHRYADIHKRLSLFFAYSNDNTPLQENDNLFVEGKSNGLFFIINDNSNKNVQNFIQSHISEYETISHVAEDNIDIYKSKLLSEKTACVEILDKSSPPPKSTPRSNDGGGDEWGGGSI